MKYIIYIQLIIVAISASAQYAPPVGLTGTTAISKDSSIIKAWATDFQNYIVGVEVDTTWQHPEKALGKAEGMSGEVVSLGRGGEITLVFEDSIINGEGPDFATFENGLNDSFLELGLVEVSQDGVNFIRFPNYSLTLTAVGSYEGVDATKISGYCSKYRQGYGTPFDLEDVGLENIKYVKIIDIVGDESAYDSDGNIIYDPYPTSGSAGVDIDGIAVISQRNVDFVNNLNNDFKFSVFPNPVKSETNLIVSSNLLNKSVKIISIYGEIIEQFIINNLNTVLKLDDLNTGVYFVKIENQTFKLIKE